MILGELKYKEINQCFEFIFTTVDKETIVPYKIYSLVFYSVWVFVEGDETINKMIIVDDVR